jgi:catechol 2,3-dioxygenase-like lactoylglutathione lyase family enzyme
MTVKHLDHLNLSVRNFEETAIWYRRVFGFEIVESGLWRGRPWGVLKSGEALLCVYQDPDRNFIDGNVLQSSRLHGVNHFALRITEQAEWEETVIRENLPIEYDGRVTWPNSTSWYVKDPTGYEIEVVYWNDAKATFV